MFGGWFALIAASYLMYRCAAANNRRRWLWIGLLWLFSFGGGILAVIANSLAFILLGVEFANEMEATYALVPAAGIGMLAGALFAVGLASRRPRQASLPAAGDIIPPPSTH